MSSLNEWIEQRCAELNKQHGSYDSDDPASMHAKGIRDGLREVRARLRRGNNSDIIEDIWYAEFRSPDGAHCGLCANHGRFDTRGIKTPNGVECGGIYYCICPNGRAMLKDILDSCSKALPEPAGD